MTLRAIGGLLHPQPLLRRPVQRTPHRRRRPRRASARRLRDFYTNHLDEAERAIAAARDEQHQARAGYTHELAEVQEQLAAKEALVDRYLTDYEGNKIDRETVARRIDKLSDQIRQLRHRSDELTFLTTLDDQDLGTSYLASIRDRIQEIISTGTPQECKTMCEALLAELRIDGDIAPPVINVPLSRDDIPASLQVDVHDTAAEAVRVRPPKVDRRLRHTNTLAVTIGPELRLPVARERRIT